MLDYVRQRPSPTISSFSIHFLTKFFMYFQIFSCCFSPIHSEAITKYSLHNLINSKTVPTISHSSTKKSLRIIYFREFDKSIEENRLKSDVKNLTDSYGIDLKLNIIEQSTSLSMYRICSLIGHERSDTIVIADLYTKEIDFLSRSLKIPTIAITNRYQIVQGKMVRDTKHVYLRK